jgi:hypothetical protein
MQTLQINEIDPIPTICPIKTALLPVSSVFTQKLKQALPCIKGQSVKSADR